MADKIEVWCVVTEDDVMSVRLVTMTRLPQKYGGSLVFEEWKAEGGVRVQCTAETEADAREWLAEHIRMQLGHAAEAVARRELDVAEANEELAGARKELEEWQARAAAAGVVGAVFVPMDE